MTSRIRLGRAPSFTDVMKIMPSRPFASTKRSSSLHVEKPTQDDLPDPTVVFKEGYLFKRGRTTSSSWRRRFFILEGNVLTYSNVFGSEVKASFTIESGTTIQTTDEFAAHEFCIEIRPPPGSPDHANPLYVAADSRELLDQWMEGFEIVLKQLAGEKLQFLPMRARFYEGTLFKTPRVPNSWEAKHMELENGVIYYFDGKKGHKKMTFKPVKKHINLRGCTIHLNRTEAKGVPFKGKPFQLIEAGSNRTYNLAAPNEEEYLRWLKAIRAWMEMLGDEGGV